MRAALLLVLASCVLAQTIAIQDSSDPTRGRISGVVQDEHGQPLAGATVRATPMGVPIAAKLPETRTDAQGRFALAGLLPGRTTVDASKEEAFYPDRLLGLWDDNSSLVVEVPSGGEIAGITLNVAPAGRLAVKAENADTGETIDAITARLERDGAPERWVEGSRAGNQWLVPPAPVRLQVQAKGFRPTWYGGNGSAEQALPITVPTRETRTILVLLHPLAR